MRSIIGILALTAATAWGTQAFAQAKKATHAVELTDAAGDTRPGEADALDVVKLSLKSDGTHLTVGATLNADSKRTTGTEAVRLYFDTDNNPATGTAELWSKKTGFEYRSELDLCVKYANGGEACGGGMKAPVAGYYAVATVDRLKGENQTEKVRGAFDTPKTPLQGRLVEAKIAYADLGVKPGQAIRIATRESDSTYDEKSFFPDVILTLK